MILGLHVEMVYEKKQCVETMITNNQNSGYFLTPLQCANKCMMDEPSFTGTVTFIASCTALGCPCVCATSSCSFWSNDYTNIYKLSAGKKIYSTRNNENKICVLFVAIFVHSALFLCYTNQRLQ